MGSVRESLQAKGSHLGKATTPAVTKSLFTPQVTKPAVQPQGTKYTCEFCAKTFASFPLAANCEKACKAKKGAVKSAAPAKLPLAVAGKPPVAGFQTVYKCDLCHKSFGTFAAATTCEKGCKLKKAQTGNTKTTPGKQLQAVKQTAFNKDKVQKMGTRRF